MSRWVFLTRRLVRTGLRAPGAPRSLRGSRALHLLAASPTRYIAFQEDCLVTVHRFPRRSPHRPSIVAACFALGALLLTPLTACLLYTSDAADERSSVDLGGRRIIKKK